MEKKSDGGFVFRAGRAEEREARRHGNAKHRDMEILFAKIQTQFEKEEDGRKSWFHLKWQPIPYTVHYF
jgi:hypothetical protein